MEKPPFDGVRVPDQFGDADDVPLTIPGKLEELASIGMDVNRAADVIIMLSDKYMGELLEKTDGHSSLDEALGSEKADEVRRFQALSQFVFKLACAVQLQTDTLNQIWKEIKNPE